MAARGRRDVANRDDTVGQVDAESMLATGDDGVYWNYFAGVVMSWNVVVGHGERCG